MKRSVGAWRRPFTVLLAGVLLLPLATVSSAVTGPYDPFFAAPQTIADFGAGTRPLGVAVGDFDGDTIADVVTGRVSGGAAVFSWQKGVGNGTFGSPTAFPWRVQVHNQWTLRTADLNGDNRLDLIWSSAVAAGNSGCTVNTTPANCATAGGTITTVNPGEVRVLYGNGNATTLFDDQPYYVTAVRFAGGTLLGDIGTAAGSLATGDFEGDGDTDIVAAGLDGTNSVVKLLTNNGAGPFAVSNLLSQASGTSGDTATPTYFPATTIQTSPWGLAMGDADGDGDDDVWIGDRALYVYLYKNNGAGAFTLTPGTTVVSGTRPNVYLAHESFRASVGFTPSLVSSDFNGDGKDDLVLGLQSGTNTPATNAAHDGELVLDLSEGSAHGLAGVLADIGTLARGVSATDINGDGSTDLVAGEYDGKVKLLRQLVPIDTDGDGISDYVDNAPQHANAARIDMNTDGSINAADQLDNDFDTVLGDPENTATWQRLGDPADTDDDNDGALDGDDNCRFASNADQNDADGDGRGDACDPLDSTDSDGDGVVDGPAADDDLFDLARAARGKWSEGDTHFVLRIDALGRLFQNEFTGLMADGATSSAASWATNCQGMYSATGDPDPGCATLPGGREVPVTVVTIPRLLWTDPEVVTWINNRNDNPLFELGQHGTYHFSNTALGDWASGPNDFWSCEFCGLTEAENTELLQAGHDTLTGNYSNRWLRDSGVTAGSPKIDWSASHSPLLSYAPPFNADDTLGRKAIANLGFKAYSSSVFEENSSLFTPEGSHFEQFDQFGVFHGSADVELEPPETANGTYDPSDYAAYLESETQDGGLNTWLIEEVEWSGRPCNDQERVGPNFENVTPTCPEKGSATTNRENNTVYRPRWDGWLQVLDYIKSYDGGVAMTMGEVALAKGSDNAPTVANPSQADADSDGIGDVVDDGALQLTTANLSRNVAGDLVALLTNGNGDPIADQVVEFTFDTDGDAVDETFSATTDETGEATVSVTPTRAVGSTTYGASWDGVVAADSASRSVDIADATVMALAATPTSGQVTDAVTLSATLVDSSAQPVVGKTVTFSVGTASATATTDAQGVASAAVTLVGPAGTQTAGATFAGDGPFGQSSDSRSFTVNKEDTALVLTNAVGTGRSGGPTTATLTEADGAAVAGRTIRFLLGEKKRNTVIYSQIGTATTNGSGVATFTVPMSKLSQTAKPLRAIFDADASFLGAQANALAYRM